MKLSLDPKAVGYGLLAAVGGLMAMTVAMTVAVNVSSPPPDWLHRSLELFGNLLPAIAGLFAARTARFRPIAHGFFAGGVCVLLVVMPALLLGNLDSGALLSVLVLMLSVWLGAILGNYWRSRRGP